MAVYFIPAVVPIAYPTLYDLCKGGLPDTFWEWRATEDAARRDLVAAGHHVVGIRVRPGDLLDYCRSVNCAADAESLAALATRIGHRRFVVTGDHLALRDEILVVQDARARRVFAGRGSAVAVGAPRRHWWQFWRPSAPQVGLDEPAVAAVEDVPVRRHWWQFWRPSVAPMVDRRPLAPRTAL